VSSGMSGESGGPREEKRRVRRCLQRSMGMDVIRLTLRAPLLRHGSSSASSTVAQRILPLRTVYVVIFYELLRARATEWF